ncbi:MAG: hypothetical protein ACM3KR_08190 [Deltaproteobacteria bacterium]
MSAIHAWNSTREVYKGEDSNIYICPYKSRDIFFIDVRLTPLYCTNCNKQLDGFYIIAGSRYGQIGSVDCCYCGTPICCGDNDHYVERLYISSGNYAYREEAELILEYKILYRLDKQIWDAVKQKTAAIEKPGYDIIERHGELELSDVIDEYNRINNTSITVREFISEKNKRFQKNQGRELKYNPLIRVDEIFLIQEKFRKAFKGRVPLSHVVDEICNEYAIDLANVEINPALLDEKIKVFPEIIVKWFKLLTVLGIE